MSEQYSPVNGSNPDTLYNIIFLSQRDLGLKVPINFVTAPGVSLKSACFTDNIYEDDLAGDCLSNLFAEGFRRIEIDLYWDDVRELWSFCPVAVPYSVPNSTSTMTTTAINPGTSSGTSKSTLTSLMPAASTDSTSSLGVRQLSDSSSSSSTTSISSSTSSATSTNDDSTGVTASQLGSAVPSASLIPSSGNLPLISIGDYTCTTTINLSILTSFLLSYIEQTENTLEAHLIYLSINLHAAASNTAPSEPAPSPSIFPSSDNLLSNIFTGNLSTYLYTPANLMDERSNLNSSWYTLNGKYRPVEGYYSITTTSTNIFQTSDGWPSESYIEFAKSKRLLLGWGQVDPQMENYNLSVDEDTIFAQNYIQEDKAVDVSANGEVTSGCFLMNDTNILSETNNSWATTANINGFDYATSSSSDLGPTLDLASNLTACGISPILNTTLLDSPAYRDYIPYRNYSYSTIWSWNHGEPRNASGDTSDPLFRCAEINSDTLKGHWKVSDCSQKYFAACRASNQPYNWTLTTYQISYTYAPSACPKGFNFAAPRTALENSYLYRMMQQSGRDFDGNGAWVDFNSLDVRGCWVNGGPNATCPYSGNANDTDMEKKTVLVPTIAALIVLVITALTVFSKVTGNHRVRKRNRRRAKNGFIYEGVPS